MKGMEDESSSSSWFSRIFGSKEEEERPFLEQSLSREAYEEYRRLLMKARPEISGDTLRVRLPDGEVELRRGKLVVRAKNRESAEKILRNLHHYESPPSLWPAYGLSYSIRRGERGRIEL